MSKAVSIIKAFRDILVIITILVVVYLIADGYKTIQNNYNLLLEKMDRINKIDEAIAILEKHDYEAIKKIDSLKLISQSLSTKNKEAINEIKKYLKSDTNNVYAVLRYWTDRLYKIPELQQDTANIR